MNTSIRDPIPRRHMGRLRAVGGPATPMPRSRRKETLTTLTKSPPPLQVLPATFLAITTPTHVSKQSHSGNTMVHLLCLLAESPPLPAQFHHFPRFKPVPKFVGGGGTLGFVATAWSVRQGRPARRAAAQVPAWQERRRAADAWSVALTTLMNFGAFCLSF